MKYIGSLLLLIWIAGLIATAVGVITASTGNRERRAVRDMILYAKASGQSAVQLEEKEAELDRRILYGRVIAGAGFLIVVIFPTARLVRRSGKRR